MQKFFRYSLQIGIIGIILCIILFATNAFYELVIPLVEKSNIKGDSFKTLDDLIFYTPLILIIPFVIYMVAGIIYIRRSQVAIENKDAKRLLKENAKRQASLDKRADFLKKHYYSNCPNCGSVRVEDESECLYCGASLIIKDED